MSGFLQEDDKSYFFDGAGYAMRWGPSSPKEKTPKQKAKATAKRKARRKRAAERKAVA